MQNSVFFEKMRAIFRLQDITNAKKDVLKKKVTRFFDFFPYGMMGFWRKKLSEKKVRKINNFYKNMKSHFWRNALAQLTEAVQKSDFL